jgi:galactose mutarotase-like enzyme
MSDWYQIENNHFVVQINTSGAEMKRLFAKSWHRELLWHPQDEQERKIWNRTSPLLFPIVGKLKDDQYHLKGKKYSMTQHGFARDWEFKCTECGSTEATFFLEATQETFKQYPFCFELQVNFRLEEKKLIVSNSVKNVDRQDIYFSIGAHPAFVTANLEDYEIHFERKERGYFQLENKLINWKNLTAFESNVLIPTKNLFANDALILKDVKSSHIDLINHKRHETIRIHGTNTPFLGLWGKDSVPFICIEPWYGVGDDTDHDQNLETKKGIQTLAMGGTFKFSYSIEILP